jgi:hypothetical protein
MLRIAESDHGWVVDLAQYFVEQILIGPQYVLRLANDGGDREWLNINDTFEIHSPSGVESYSAEEREGLGRGLTLFMIGTAKLVVSRSGVVELSLSDGRSLIVRPLSNFEAWDDVAVWGPSS